jgi:Staphylococcal nuclease homologue
VTSTDPRASVYRSDTSQSPVGLAEAKSSPRFGWYTLPRSRSAYRDRTTTPTAPLQPGEVDRPGLVDLARAAAPADNVALSEYFGVVLEADVVLDNVDHYGRLLRYIRRNRSNLNLELVRCGEATPTFYRGDRGRYASRLVPRLARRAQPSAASGAPVRARDSIRTRPLRLARPAAGNQQG